MEYLQYFNSTIVNISIIGVLNLVISGIPSILECNKLVGEYGLVF